MPFKYNDKLIIKDREQMEDLFRYRLRQFDFNRTKKVSITNDLGTNFRITGHIDRKTNTLELYISRINNGIDGTVDITLGHGDKGTVDLVLTMDLE